ncbi:hypothetical protein NJ76_08965 [Rhodococcus sp. IITR03]|nr:hypothetical protein NJ76_08965 [Rhodococcus sp. IITR03]
MSAGADDGVVAVRQRNDQVVDVRGAGRGLDLVVGRVRLRVAQVLPDGRVEEVGLLRDHADQSGEIGEPHVAQVDAVDAHASLDRVVQSCDERAERGLARAGLADERDLRSCRDVEVDPVERVAVRSFVAEAHVLEPHPAGDGRRVDGHRIARVVDVDGKVEVFEDAAEQGQRTGDGDTDVEQAHQRPEQRALQAREGHQGADRHAVRGGRQTGDEIEDRGDRREDDVHRGHAPAAGQLRVHLEIGEFLRRAGELVGQCRAGAQRLDEQHTADRQSFVDLRLHVGEAPLLTGGDGAAHECDPACEPDGRREHDQGEQGQSPAEDRHGDRRADDGGDVGRQRGRGVGDHGLHTADVVGQPRLDLTAAGAGEEVQRLSLQVGEDPGTQTVHDVLADGRGDPVWTTDRSELATVTASIPPTAHSNRLTFWCGMASSMTARTRKGVARETTDEAMMSATTRVIFHRWGAKRAPIRRRLTGASRSCSRSFLSILPRLPGLPPRPGGGCIMCATSIRGSCSVLIEVASLSGNCQVR